MMDNNAYLSNGWSIERFVYLTTNLCKKWFGPKVEENGLGEDAKHLCGELELEPVVVVDRLLNRFLFVVF